ncbi:hypothetical protein CLOM_g8032 [Closterium sp. NIES-68]|nr:hypothetical protein CLOM_g18491 [Closterium sp. NIES-68]GJP48757.1 hypothetical protein CLOM_g8032 [Closterium sp. NIES-68]GJP69507.1 hypothetical protein CLOP_g512 [Closterium sp. NIES-67]
MAPNSTNADGTFTMAANDTNTNGTVPNSNPKTSQHHTGIHRASAKDVAILHKNQNHGAAAVAPSANPKSSRWQHRVGIHKSSAKDVAMTRHRNQNHGAAHATASSTGNPKASQHRAGIHKSSSAKDVAMTRQRNSANRGATAKASSHPDNSKSNARGMGIHKASAVDVAIRHRNQASRGAAAMASSHPGNSKANGRGVGFHKASAEDAPVTHRSTPLLKEGQDGRKQNGVENGRKGAMRVSTRGETSFNDRFELEGVEFHKATSDDVALHRRNRGAERSSSRHGVNRGAERLGSLSSAQGKTADYGGDYNDDYGGGHYNGDYAGGHYSGDNGGDYSGEYSGDNGSGGDYSDGDSGGGDSGSGGSSGSIDIAAILDMHNAARREVCVLDLAWDDGVAAAAQDWANNLASRGCPLEHGGADGLGQNLYWRAPAGLTPEEDRMAVQSWVDEKADWTYSPVPEGCAEGRMCGHYTQVVWGETTHVGCASAQCPDGGGIWVCDYSPQGNVIGSTPF